MVKSRKGTRRAPRLPQGPRQEPQGELPLATPQTCESYLLTKLTTDQIRTLKAAAAVGLHLSEEARTFAKRERWMLSSKGAAGRDVGDSVVRFGVLEGDAHSLPAPVLPLVRLGLTLDRARMAERDLSRAAKALHEFFDKNCIDLKFFRHPRQAMAAFILMVADQLKVELEPLQMAALVALVGDRVDDQEFKSDPEATDEVRESWRSILNKVKKKDLLDKLRSLDTEMLPKEAQDS